MTDKDHTIEDTLRELRDDPTLERRRATPWDKYGAYIMLATAAGCSLFVGLQIGVQIGVSQYSVISEIHANAMETQRSKMQDSIDKLSADLASIATISAQGQANATAPQPVQPQPKNE